MAIDANSLTDLGFNLQCETWEVRFPHGGSLTVVLWDDGPEWMVCDHHILGPQTVDDLKVLLRVLGVSPSA
jgi:hypothetical protein